MLIVFTVYVPTNSGLRCVREKGLEIIRKDFSNLEIIVKEVRGEAIPKIIDESSLDKLPTIGITGDDLFEEYLTMMDQTRDFEKEGPQLKDKRQRLIYGKLSLSGKGEYSNSLFGLPTLCVLGKGGINLKEFVKRFGKIYGLKLKFQDKDVNQNSKFDGPNFYGTKVAIPKRYRYLIKSRIDLNNSDIVELDGQVDVTAAKGEADYAIDIVLSGRTAIDEGLGIYGSPIFMSDGIILSNYSGQKISENTPRTISEIRLWIETGNVIKPNQFEGRLNISSPSGLLMVGYDELSRRIENEYIKNTE